MNQAIVLSKHPVGKVTESDFQLVERPSLPCEEGFFRTKNMWLSLDAGFRHWMAEGAGDNYLPGMQIGDPVQGCRDRRGDRVPQPWLSGGVHCER